MRLEDFGGAVLKWPEDPAKDGGLTVRHVAAGDSQWSVLGGSSFMINNRVNDLGGLLAQLREAGVEVIQGPESQ